MAVHRQCGTEIGQRIRPPVARGARAISPSSTALTRRASTSACRVTSATDTREVFNASTWSSMTASSRRAALPSVNALGVAPRMIGPGERLTPRTVLIDRLTEIGRIDQPRIAARRGHDLKRQSNRPARRMDRTAHRLGNRPVVGAHRTTSARTRESGTTHRMIHPRPIRTAACARSTAIAAPPDRTAAGPAAPYPWPPRETTSQLAATPKPRPTADREPRRVEGLRWFIEISSCHKGGRADAGQGQRPHDAHTENDLYEGEDQQLKVLLTAGSGTQVLPAVKATEPASGTTATRRPRQRR